MKSRKERGITLIALVVTIIVLLILAGITIGALTGDNGIINKAKKAKEETEIAQWEEKIDAAIIDVEKKHRNPTIDDVIDELIKDEIIEDESKVDRTTGAITTKEPVHTIEGKLDDYLGKEEPSEPVVAEHTVTYNYSENGGTSADVPSMSVKEGESIDLTKKATKNGYDFVGWNTDVNAHEGLQELSMESKDITLYAIYSKQLTVTLDYLNSSLENTKMETTIYNKETSGQIKLPKAQSIYGNAFVYWNTENDGTGTRYLASQTITLSRDITLYAIWYYVVTTPSVPFKSGENVIMTFIFENINDIKSSYQLYKASTETGDGELTSRATLSISGNSIIARINNVTASDAGYYYLVITTNTYGNDVKIETPRIDVQQIN